jgi:Flp pilus assembly protein TadD
VAGGRQGPRHNRGRAVAAWTSLFLLAWPAISAAQFPGQEDAGGVSCPPAKPRVSVAGRAAPTEKEYLALVAREQQKAARDMSTDGMRTIDRTVLAAPRAAAGADLGLIFLSINDVSAAVYATTISAKRDPADALTANNLGSALKVARAYDSACAVLLYANARQPDSPIVLTNLGNVAFALGDGHTAEDFYRQALAARPDHPAALTGLGSLALCRGDEAGAARYFRKASSDMYLPAARAGLEELRSGGESETGEGKPGSPRSQPSAAQNTPISHPAGKGGGQGISLPDPPISGSARQTGRRLDDFERLVQEGQTQIDDLSQRVEALSTAIAGEAAAASGPSGARRLVLRNPYDKEAFVLDDLWRIFDARIAERSGRLLPKGSELLARTQERQVAIMQQLAAEIAACGDNDRCIKAAELKACRARHALASQTHGEFRSIWQELWQGTHKDLSDYHAFTTPWLQDVHGATANQLYNINRQMYILSQATALYALAQGEAQLTAELTEEDCTAFEEKGEVWDSRPLKVWPDDPMKCRSGTLYISVVFATVEGDCDKLEVEFAAGVFVSGEYRWGNTASEDQVTLWGGLGGTLGAGPVKGTAKIGAYVTYQLSGESAKMVDCGVKDAAGVSLKLGPAKVEAAAEARFSAETGPTVDYSLRPKVGVGI